MPVPNRDNAAIQLAALLDAIDDAVVTTDLNSIITSWNVAAERLYGFASEAVVGRSIHALLSEGQPGEEKRLLSAVQDGESLREFETVRQRANGVLIPVALTIAPLRAVGGAVVGTLRISRVLGGQRLADGASHRLAALVESSDDAIVSKDLNGIVTSWNVAAERMFGYTAVEMIGQSIRKIIPADRQNEEDRVLEAIRRGDKVDHFETVRKRKDGSAVPISLTVSPIHDASGRVAGASKIARDISDRKRAEQEHARLLEVAQQSAATTEKLNEVGAVVASALDQRAIVQAVTDTATALTTAEIGAFFSDQIGEHGQSRPLLSFSGRPPDAIPYLPMPRDAAALARTFNGAAVMRSPDITADPAYGKLGKDKERAPGLSRVKSYLAVSVRARSGDVLGGLFFGHSRADVFTADHERLAVGIASWAAVALENARLYAEAQSANQLKDEFLATLSHELRTPLNAILGYARMIRSGMVAPEHQERAVATIERNAASLTQIVEDVLDVSRIVSGKLRLNIEDVQISDMINNSIEAIMPAADAKGIRLECAIGAEVDTVPGDVERLQQIVWNLLSNAVKFTDRSGRVEIRVGMSEDCVDIVVSDNGIGIRPEFLPHLFERFRQADSSTTRERGGLGLGLSIVRQLVEMHGGTIHATSEGANRGSTFQIRLPVAITPAVARTATWSVTARTREALPTPDLTGLRVLVVDDDRDALMMVRDILESVGVRAAIADSATAALNAIETESPDLLVADLGMPHMDGFELIGRIRASKKLAVRTVPAIALTAYARSEDRARALRAGFQLHVPKPIDPALLLRSVADVARAGIPRR